MQAKWEEMKEEEQKNQSLRNKIGAKNKQKLVKSLLSQTQRRQRLLELLANNRGSFPNVNAGLFDSLIQISGAVP